MLSGLQQIEVVSIAGRLHGQVLFLPHMSPSAANRGYCCDVQKNVQKTFSIFPSEGMLQPSDTYIRLWFEYLTETE